MFKRINRLPIELPKPEHPDPNAASAVQELLGGRFGEMSTILQAQCLSSPLKFRPRFHQRKVSGAEDAGQNAAAPAAAEAPHKVSDEEVAESLDWDVSKVKSVKTVAREPVSLETPIGEEEDNSLGEFIEDKNFENPSNLAIFSDLQDKLNEVIKTLTKKEQDVLRMRYGLDDGCSLTLEQVGSEFNVTRERIRQIEAKALRKMRHPVRLRKLKDHLDNE